MSLFDEQIERKNTKSVKWDGTKALFGHDDLLPMWVADMDFRPPKEVLDALRERVDHGIFGYTITPQSTTEAIINWTEQRHGWSVSPSWIIYSTGVVPSIYTVIQALTEQGDKILLQSPVYTPFFQMIERNERVVSNSPLILDNGRYEIDFDDFEQQLKSGVKLFLLCNPHNPAGRVWDKEELMKMGELCHKYNIPIVADEIHADLVAQPYKHIPIAALSESFSNMTITLMAPSKTFNLAGLQASFMVIPNTELRKKITDAQAKEGFFSLNTFGSIAMEAAYTYGSDWLDSALQYIRENIKLVKKEIKEHIPQLEVIEPEGTYLIWIDCRKLGLSDNELRKRLVEKGKLALNMGEAYGPGGEGFVRMNVACSRSTVIEGLARLRKAFTQD